ncbi:MAG: LamG-like jellyroll fold domain-containing protein [Verrucomicrobiota bacterium]
MSFPHQLEPGEVSEIQMRIKASSQAGQRQGILEIQSNDADEDLIRIRVVVSTDNQSSLATHLTFDEAPSPRLLPNAAPFGNPALANGELVFGESPGLHPMTGGSAHFTNGVVEISDQLGDEITLALWAQQDPLSNDIQTVCGAGGSEAAWALVLVEGKLAWTADGNITATSVSISDEPFHLVASISRSLAKVEVEWMLDGVLQPRVELPENEESVGNLVFIGAYGEGVLPFRGWLDDFQIYDRSLSSDEMKRLHENPGETLGTLGVPDSDGDSLLDEAEREQQTDPLDPDTDADGLSDGREIELGSNPLERDSDGGGTWDGTEVLDGSDPLKLADDLPIWTIHTLALRTPKELTDIPIDSTKGLDIFSEFTFQRRFVDFEDKNNAELGLIAGGQDLDEVGLAIKLQQIHYITGRIAVEEGGLYTLGIAHGSSFRLLVDGEVVIEALKPGRGRIPVALSLTPGVHQIELQARRGRFLELFHWEAPGDFTSDPPWEQATLLGTDHVDDIDVDEDGLPDFWELTLIGNLDLGADDDPDADGLRMREEFEALTHPLRADSDDDGLSDSAELQTGTNPNAPDSDGDGLDDGEEIEPVGTNPLKDDSDGDGLSDGFEVARQLDPLGQEDDSVAFLKLHYDFEAGAGTSVENLVGGSPGDLYSWDVNAAWGQANEPGSRGSGYLKFLAPDPEVVEPAQPHLIPLERFEPLRGIDVSQHADGSTILATKTSPESLGLGSDGYTMMAWVRADRFLGGLGGLTNIFTQVAEDGSLLGLDGGTPFLSHGGSFLRSSGELSPQQWHHVVWRYDGVATDFFIDGQPGTIQRSGLKPIVNEKAEWIISWMSGRSRTLVGGLDDVRIYAAPLRKGKVLQLAGVTDEPMPDLKITSISRLSDAIAIGWEQGTPGRGYSVEYSESLNKDWQTIAEIEGNGIGTYFDRDVSRITKDQGFYRMRLLGE